MKNYDVIIVGCGLSGAIVARQLADNGYNVLIIEQRNHVGGNMYDYMDENGVLVHKYGPHTFHTVKKSLYDIMCKYSDWDDYKLECGAVIDGIYTPTPFNYQTIDDFFSKEDANNIKAAIESYYQAGTNVPVTELLSHENEYIKNFAEFLFEKDYSLYTAKQWGISPKEIDPSILKRVPVRFSYTTGYFDDKYQCMPRKSYTDFFENLLNSENITVMLEHKASEYIKLEESTNSILFENKGYDGIVVYTGAIDELFGCRFGKLPYRSLRFEWKSENVKSFQNAPVVAYPQAEGFTRITEYTKLPKQEVGNVTSYAVEYPIPYMADNEMEPYYPVLTELAQEIYDKYIKEAKKYKNLFLTGRLADFKYYNMDQALERAIEIGGKILRR